MTEFAIKGGKRHVENARDRVETWSAAGTLAGPVNIFSSKARHAFGLLAKGRHLCRAASTGIAADESVNRALSAQV